MRILLAIVIICFYLTGCKKQNNNVVGLGYWNLPAYGKPVEEMQDFIKLIDSCDKNSTRHAAQMQISGAFFLN